MNVSIIEGFHQPATKTIKENTFYEQKAYADFEGPYPVEFKIALNAPVDAYPIGSDYELDPSSYKVNQYGNLELDRFNIKLRRKSQAMKKVS
jgi:hypothetical protein